MKLKKLLNSLIERGWKPQGVNVEKCIGVNKDEFGDIIIGFLGGYDDIDKKRSTTIRELVSIESGFWQFVCENKLTKTNKNGKYLWECYFQYNNSEKIMAYQKNGLEYEYWLIESALIPDNKLVSFILENVDISD